MKPSNIDIGVVLEKSLDHHSKSISFESTWNMHLNEKQRTIRPSKQTAILLVALIMFFTIGSVAIAGIMRNIDKTDYIFANDPRVIGKWESVDYVKKIDDFIPGKILGNQLYLSTLVFSNQGKTLLSVENGNLAHSTFSWTKDKLLNRQEKTASDYIIKEIDGSTYMYFEWKNGDYRFRNTKPSYYVLKKVDSNDYSNYQVVRMINDKIDYPFIDDTQMKGKWESVDFVKTIDSFKPEVISCMSDLFLTGLSVNENGQLTSTDTSGKSSPSLTWTRGMIINKEYKTASKCVMKEIDGTTYMFYEWKSGDYTDRGMTPQYYVLKKVQ